MNRRTFLTSCIGGFLALSGCNGQELPSESIENESGQMTTPGRPNTTADTVPTEYESDISVSSPVLQPHITVLGTADTFRVDTASGHQFLFVPIDAEERNAPKLGAFAFHFAEDVYSPLPHEEVRRSMYSPLGKASYTRDRGEGLLVFKLPETGSTEDTKLEWASDKWTPSESLKKRLAAKHPELTASVDLPETVEYGDPYLCTVTITNEGDIPGRFVATLHKEDGSTQPVKRVSWPIPATETVERVISDDEATNTFTSEAIDDQPDLIYSFGWGNGRKTQDVRIT